LIQLFAASYLYKMAPYQNYRPSSSTPPVTLNLIILNVVVFFAQQMMDREGGLGLTGKLMLYPVTDPHFSPYQLVTHMFAHANFTHILFNMFALWMFGRILETFWGPKRFFIFYFASGLGAAALHLGVEYLRYRHAVDLANAGDVAAGQAIVDQMGPALGASGAVMGVFAAFAYLFPNTELYMWFIPIPLKAKWVVSGLIALDLFGGFSNTDNVAHWAHLGGALVGFIIVYFWNKTNRRTFY